MVMTKSRVCCVLLFLISAILLFPAISPAQSFQYRKAITIDDTLVPASLTDFPVLISILNDSDLRDHVTNPNGYDLVFTDVGGTQLDHEVESWNGSTGTLLAWVRVPALSSTADTVIYICYGNSGITTSQEPTTGVWDSSYKGVWHLKEATGANLADSTSNGRPGTPQTSPPQTAGHVDG